jgi:hypothetical protein
MVSRRGRFRAAEAGALVAASRSSESRNADATALRA